MSVESAAERRLAPRINLGDGIDCRLDLRARVRLVDISFGGALLAAEFPVPVGAAAQLHSGLGGNVLRAHVQVRRTVGVPLKGLGAMFTDMDERSRRSLEEFLRKASQ